jgi:hypothetical protein
MDVQLETRTRCVNLTLTFRFTLSVRVHICLVVEPWQVQNRLHASIRYFTPRFTFQVAAHVCVVVEPLSTSHCKIPVVVGCSIDLLSSQSSHVYPAPGSRPGSDWLELCNVVLPLLTTRRGQARSRSGSTLRSQQGHLQTVDPRVRVLHMENRGGRLPAFNAIVNR